MSNQSSHPVHVFHAPPVLIVGVGCIAQLGTHVAPLGRRVLLVSGESSARQSGVLHRAEESLADSGCSVVLFDAVTGEPDLDTIDRGRSRLRENSCDCVVALGGGSALDAGKVIAGLANQVEPTLHFWTGEPVTFPGLPFVALPTTAGTGSEVTNNGVITNPAIPAKRSIRDPRFIARMALVDPELTVTCPPEVTAASGIDALVQAIESFTSRHAWPLTDALALRAIELLHDGLLAAYRNPEDLDARTANSTAALLAGLALSNARLGLVHGLAHPIGARFHIPHGVVCGVLLPHVMELNRPLAAAKFRAIDHIFGGDAVTRIRRLIEKLDLSTTLGPRRFSKTDFAPIIDEALQSGSTLANPREVTPDDCFNVLCAASGLEIPTPRGRRGPPAPDEL